MPPGKKTALTSSLVTEISWFSLRKSAKSWKSTTGKHIMYFSNLGYFSAGEYTNCSSELFIGEKAILTISVPLLNMEREIMLFPQEKHYLHIHIKQW